SIPNTQYPISNTPIVPRLKVHLSPIVTTQPLQPDRQVRRLKWSIHADAVTLWPGFDNPGRAAE
ncbi:MAG: hypothetical protein ACE5HA_05515, partial [Anaerolineae bacterium]